MHRQTCLCLILLTLGAARDAAPAAQPMLPQLQAAAAYIKVEGVGNDNRPCTWSGSGVGVLPGGWVLTNRHVAPGNARTANTVRVVFNAGTPEEFSGPADVVWVHPDRDLTLLRCRLSQSPTPLPLGPTDTLELTDPVLAVGFPLGGLVAAKAAHPSVTIVRGEISALRNDEQGRLCWIDVAAPVAGGNSGGALVDNQGRLIGIVTQRYEGFARVLPVRYIEELLGEAALDVTLTPAAEVAGGGRVEITVKPRGPATSLILGQADVSQQEPCATRLLPAPDGSLTGSLPVPATSANHGPPAIRIRATDAAGFTCERIVGWYRTGEGQQPLRGTIHSVTLAARKANGWRWDIDAPDIFCKLYIDGLLVQQTAVAKNRFRFLEAAEFDCAAGDDIRIVVYDKDISRDDWAGEIVFKAEPEASISAATAGQIEACDITLRPIPLRLPPDR